MLTEEEIQEHLVVLQLGYDPSSPFYGMINFEGDEGLLSLPVEEQWQVRNAMSPELVEMVFGKED